MTLTIIKNKLGTETFEDVTDFQIEQGSLILERNGGQSFKVYNREIWYEADINVVKGELTDGTN